MGNPILASCHKCGDVELTPREVEVRIDTGAAAAEQRTAFYNFICPSHGGLESRPAQPKVIAWLISAGCEVIEYDFAVPTEHRLIEERKGVLTEDELEDFEQNLDKWDGSLAGPIGEELNEPGTQE